MGINVRVSDVPTPFAARVTAERERREKEVRDRVRSGEMSLDTYLVQFRGFRPEHLDGVRERFRDAIFGPAQRRLHAG